MNTLAKPLAKAILRDDRYRISLPQNAPHACKAEQVIDQLGVSRSAGLSERDATARLVQFRRNLLARRQPITMLKILWDQIASPVVALLGADAAVSLVYGQFIETLAIGVVLLLNTTIGFFTEIRAVRLMEALRKLGRVTTRIRRCGRVDIVPAQDLVPGDIALLEGGDTPAASPCSASGSWAISQAARSRTGGRT